MTLPKKTKLGRIHHAAIPHPFHLDVAERLGDYCVAIARIRGRDPTAISRRFCVERIYIANADHTHVVYYQTDLRRNAVGYAAISCNRFIDERGSR